MINIIKSKSGDWGLGIGDWAQSPIPNPLLTNLFNNNLLVLSIKIKIQLFY